MKIHPWTSLTAEQAFQRLHSTPNALGKIHGGVDSSLVGKWSLSHFGPLGGHGPLSSEGPFRPATPNWNTGYPTSGLGPQGPLGDYGPLAKISLKALLAMNAATWSLFPGNLLGLLGPGGVLGPLGLTGPLGPRGSHGLKAAADGSYHEADPQVVHNLRGFELFEFYPESPNLPDHDTSFGVAGSLAKSDEIDRFRMSSLREQWISILVVPESTHADSQIARDLWLDSLKFGPAALSEKRLNYWNERADEWFDQFRLELRDGGGELVAESQTDQGPNWIQVKVPGGARMELALSCNRSWHDGPKDYRLLVTGAGPAFAQLEYPGEPGV